MPAMEAREPSKTARGAAVLRAAHQLIDEPPLFADPLAVRILDGLPDSPVGVAREHFDGDGLQRLRASVALRSRYAEDSLEQAMARGVRQYVVLGAGLDTFAYRNPYAADGLRVFEVDHPATQQWKRERLQQVGIPIPDSLTFVAIDFERETLGAALERARFDRAAPAFLSWLGVTVYLTRAAVMDSLRFVASTLAAGSEIVFSYTVSASPYLAKRTASLGEPWMTWFDPDELARDLLAMGFRDVHDLTPDEANRRYLDDRADQLRVGAIGHLMRARL
jgi:methyltransferase (TIGR00027 family)